jgi:hypothetical protein
MVPGKRISSKHQRGLKSYKRLWNNTSHDLREGFFQMELQQGKVEIFQEDEESPQNRSAWEIARKDGVLSVAWGSVQKWFELLKFKRKTKGWDSDHPSKCSCLKKEYTPTYHSIDCVHKGVSSQTSGLILSREKASFTVELNIFEEWAELRASNK